MALKAQGRNAEAKKEFEAALIRSPDVVEPLAELASMAIADRAPDVALERVKLQTTRAPKSARIQRLLGSLYVARGEPDQAEGAFLKALALEPGLTDAYLALANLYRASGKYDRALEELDRALKVNPKNLTAHMLSGVVYQQQGKVPEAQRALEQTLALDPRFAPAANNLAFLYAVNGGDRERALQLAQLAKQVAPEEPHISDTLGWILYTRGVYRQAGHPYRLRELKTASPA